jgi:hypothetical protein
MQPRTSERFAHRFRIEYCGISVAIEGHGVVIDLSKSGCRMEANIVPTKGAELKVQLFLADYSWPMKVDRAVVRWVKNRTVGLEFVTLQTSQRDRLTRVIMKLKQDAGY